jgi:hypothetical protein
MSLANLQILQDSERSPDAMKWNPGFFVRPIECRENCCALSSAPGFRFAASGLRCFSPFLFSCILEQHWG